MSVVADRLDAVVLGVPRSHDNLTVLPLLGGSVAAPDYRLLEAALERGCARVTEVSERGSVPELKLGNRCRHPVLLLDGDELAGAKQNRIVNLSVLAPAGETLVIPVSCVEAGRWQADSENLVSAGRTYYASGRARKAAQITRSLRATGSRRSNQSAVWADISGKADRLRARSATEAAGALYEIHRDRLQDYVHALPAVDGQCGALFALHGVAIGLELFDSPVTLRAVLPRLVESYALDAIDAPEWAPRGHAPLSADAVDAFLGRARAADAQAFPAVGEGEDLRLQGEGVVGAALARGGRLIHLCAFAMPGQGHA